jgi:hypothetical protein
MKRDEFTQILQHFAQRPMPALRGRHVYLWHGELDSLRAILPGGLDTWLDLHQLAVDLPRAPRSRDEAGRLLRQAIQSGLDGLVPAQPQQVVMVTGCDLLSRYQVPISPFFERASDSFMVIFIVPSAETRFDPTVPVPRYVSLKPEAPFDYVQAQIANAGVVVIGEE